MDNMGERIVAIEAHLQHQTALLEKLVPVPEMCAARGVQLETLNGLPDRVTHLEADLRLYRRLAGILVTVSAGIATHRVWGGISEGLRRIFI